MAKTMKRPRRKPATRQAPPGVWSPEALQRALEAGSPDDKLATLREIGLITSDGKLAPRYKSWGAVVSRTADDDRR